jgi:hypothetical protein
MAIKVYPYLTTVRLLATWKLSNVAIDPDTVTVRIINPAGTVTTFIYITNAEVVRDSTGVFRYDLALTVEGIYYYRFEGVGPGVNSSFDGKLECSRSSFV